MSSDGGELSKKEAKAAAKEAKAQERAAAQEAERRRQAEAYARRVEEKKAADEEQQRLAEQEAFLASPVGQATTARVDGLRFFEIQLEVRKYTDSWSRISDKVETYSHLETLSGIEEAGWTLEHVGYFYQPEKTSTTESMVSKVGVHSGTVVGVYLFRAAE